MNDWKPRRLKVFWQYARIVLSSARKNPVTASLVTIWLAVGGCFWYWMFRADINLMLNVIPWTVAFFVLLLIFIQILMWIISVARYSVRVIFLLFDFVHALSKERKANSLGIDANEFKELERNLRARLPGAQLMNFQSIGIFQSMSTANEALAKWFVRLPILLFSLSFSTSLFFAAYISGDWTNGKKIPACFLGFHLHHWQSSAFALIALLYVATRSRAAYPKLGRYAYGLSGFLFLVLIGLAGVSSLFQATVSLWILLLVYITSSFFMGRILRSQEIQSLWFALLLAVLIGVSAGTFVDGVRGTIDHFPSPIIYYDGCGK